MNRRNRAKRHRKRFENVFLHIKVKYRNHIMIYIDEAKHYRDPLPIFLTTREQVNFENLQKSKGKFLTNLRQCSSKISEMFFRLTAITNEEKRQAAFLRTQGIKRMSIFFITEQLRSVNTFCFGQKYIMNH